jgi:hypothetical protein
MDRSTGDGDDDVVVGQTGTEVDAFEGFKTDG